MRLTTLTLIFSLALPLCAAAQSLQPLTDDDRVFKLEGQLAATEQMVIDLGAELTTLRDQSEVGLLAAAQAQNEAVIDHLNYESALRRHAQLVLWWQLISSYVILGLVCVVTVLGVILSYREVINAMKAPEKAMETFARHGALEDGGGGDGDAPLSAKGTTLIVSAQKLQVTSAITGVVILVLSLAFLYLFVVQVLEVVPRDFSSELAPTDAAAEGSDEGDA